MILFVQIVGNSDLNQISSKLETQKTHRYRFMTNLCLFNLDPKSVGYLSIWSYMALKSLTYHCFHLTRNMRKWMFSVFYIHLCTQHERVILIFLIRLSSIKQIKNLPLFISNPWNFEDDKLLADYDWLFICTNQDKFITIIIIKTGWNCE